eukprot:jgi/Picre1/33984/NNA_001461.t1
MDTDIVDNHDGDDGNGTIVFKNKPWECIPRPSWVSHVGVQHHGWYRVPSERVLVTHALGDSKNKDSSNSGLKREDEPEEYWSSERERKGESPFKDPLAIIGIVSILFPFIFLIIASSVGLVDLSPR